MSYGLAIGDDDNVAKWVYAAFQRYPLPVDRALGIVNSDGTLTGAVLLHYYNSANIHLSYYGPQTVSVGIVRSVARIIIREFNVSRVTVVIPKKSRRLLRSVQKLGWKLEGSQRCYFGHRDCRANTGVRFVMFRQQLEKLAKLPEQQNAQYAPTGLQH